MLIVEAGFHLTISKAALLESVIFLSQLLKHEFIYNTTTDINTHFLNTISLMIERYKCGCTIRVQSAFVFNLLCSKPYRSILATCGENGEMLTVHPSGYDTFLFLCMLVWPFVEVYWYQCHHDLLHLTCIFNELASQGFCKSMLFIDGIMNGIAQGGVFGSVCAAAGRVDVRGSAAAVGERARRVALLRRADRVLRGAQHGCHQDGLSLVW